jgi:hypothetical protein
MRSFGQALEDANRGWPSFVAWRWLTTWSGTVEYRTCTTQHAEALSAFKNAMWHEERGRLYRVAGIMAGCDDDHLRFILVPWDMRRQYAPPARTPTKVTTRKLAPIETEEAR